MKRYQAKW